jgi:DNA-binding transcriptional LysR family regulator
VTDASLKAEVERPPAKGPSQFQADDVYRALSLVAAGIGVAIVPSHFAVSSVRQVPVKEDLDFTRTIGLIWPRERKNGPLKEFIKFSEGYCLAA